MRWLRALAALRQINYRNMAKNFTEDHLHVWMWEQQPQVPQAGSMVNGRKHRRNILRCVVAPAVKELYGKADMRDGAKTDVLLLSLISSSLPQVNVKRNAPLAKNGNWQAEK